MSEPFDQIRSLISDVEKSSEILATDNRLLSAFNDDLASKVSSLSSQVSELSAENSELKSRPSIEVGPTPQIIKTGQDIDVEIARLKIAFAGKPLDIRIEPGLFLSNGFSVGTTFEAPWTIRCAGIEETVIRLKDVGASGFRSPLNVVIGSNLSPGWIHDFTVSDLTLDANWPGQSERLSQNVKFGCVFIQATRATIERVRCVNWGSNGKNPAQNECFPIALATYCDEGTLLTVQDNIIEQQWRDGAAYATGICVVTSQDRPGRAAGDRIRFGDRLSTAAIVRRNRIHNIYGHGIGCGWSENVIFEDNVVTCAKAGANIDTGWMRNVSFRSNKFIDCNQGIHAGASEGKFKGLEVSENYIALSEPFVNRFLPANPSEFAYGLKATGEFSGLIASKNTIVSIAGSRSMSDGFYGFGIDSDSTISGDNVYVGISTPIAVKPRTTFKGSNP